MPAFTLTDSRDVLRLIAPVTPTIFVHAGLLDIDDARLLLFAIECALIRYSPSYSAAKRLLDIDKNNIGAHSIPIVLIVFSLR
jgi:hypothetical protein